MASLDRRRTLLILLGVVGMGCATTRGTLDVVVPLPADPSDGIAVQIAHVVDARSFQARPPDPSIPSLKNAGEIHDEAITSRAIARKRNSYGMAMGDILLPEGRTVAALARDALVRGFRNAGYRVVSSGDPAFAEALPVEARIDQFWAWVTPGFWAMAIEFETRMHVTFPAGSFTSGEEIRGYVRLKSAAVSTGKWRTTVDKGLEDFSTSLTEALEQAGTPSAGIESQRKSGASEIEARFRSWKGLTSRADAECFDACR